MPQIAKPKHAEPILNQIAADNNLGEIESYYFGFEKGLLAAKNYYLGCTGGAFIVVPLSAMNLQPKGNTEIIPWPKVNIAKIKNLPLGVKDIKMNFMGNKHSFRVSGKAIGWKDNNRFVNFMTSIEKHQ